MALARAWKQMSWFYYQYLLVTALYMLEPWERTVFSILPGPLERVPGWGAGLILPGPELGVGGGEAGSVVGLVSPPRARGGGGLGVRSFAPAVKERQELLRSGVSHEGI